MENSTRKLIVIAGPTAVGKTAVAIQLAQHFQTEIISADSRQFFRELTIGTAKPSPRELALVPHHFINSHSIKDEITAARFATEALELINGLFHRYNYLVLCGGSGLYIKGICEGFDEIPQIPEYIRDELNRGYETQGISWLQEKMKQLDPAHYENMEQQNPLRLIRALEIKIGTGSSISSFQQGSKRKNPFQTVKIGLELEREELYKRIDDRMDAMIAAGLFEEAERLYPFRDYNALQTVGYREIFDYIEGKYDQEEAIRLLKRNSRRYAKRQLTWFKKDTEMAWFDALYPEKIISYIIAS